MKKKLILLFFLYACGTSFAQVDSVFNAYDLNAVSNNSWDTVAVKKLLDYTVTQFSLRPKFVDSIIDRIFQNSNRIKNSYQKERLLTSATIMKGNCALQLGEFEISEKYYRKVLNNKKSNELEKIKAIGNIGILNFHRNDLAKAIENYLIAAEGLKKLNLPAVNQYFNIGTLYKHMGFIQKSEYYYLKTLVEAKKYNDTTVIVSCYNELGEVFRNKNNPKQAYTYFEKALKIAQKKKSFRVLAMINDNLGNLRLDANDSQGALKFFKTALEYRRIIDQNITVSYLNVLQIYLKENKLNVASKYLDSLKVRTHEFNDLEEKRTYLALTSLFYQKSGKFKLSLEKLIEANKVGDSIKKLEDLNEINKIEQQYAIKSAQLSDSIKYAIQINNIKEKNQLSNEKKTAQLKLQKGMLIFSIVFTFFLGLGIIYVFNLYKNKKNANEVIAQQKQLADEQKAEIAEKNKELTDSINYAKNLQDALIPSKNALENKFNDVGLIYMPKDIVSGDFYWFHQNDDVSYIAVADCTGHGVPGAMVSIIGVNSLERCLKENNLNETDEILNQLNAYVEATFSTHNYDINDGMDISLIKFNHTTRKVSFAGAYNPLWIFTEEENIDCNGEKYLFEKNNLTVLKADKQPIGKFRNRIPFTKQEFTLPINSAICMFTDGMADQFGGSGGKKMKSIAIRKCISDNLKFTAQEIGDILLKDFLKWKHNTAQIDDVTLLLLKL